MSTLVVLVELPHVIEPVTHLRGTTMAASLTTLEEQGILPAFWQKLAPRYHAAVRGVVAPSWIDLELALAYYGALDALSLPEHQAVNIGRSAAQRLQSTFLKTLVRGMPGTVTPATVLTRVDKLWTRNFRGGAVRVVQKGPKDLELEMHRAQFLDYRYSRLAMMGYLEQTLNATARKLVIRERDRPGAGTAAWSISWV
jgi:hypothetical protein